jgi:hypothetical protein
LSENCGKQPMNIWRKLWGCKKEENKINSNFVRENLPLTFQLLLDGSEICGETWEKYLGKKRYKKVWDNVCQMHKKLFGKKQKVTRDLKINLLIKIARI